MVRAATPLKYVSQELMEPPHAACPGCAIPLVFRYILKAVGGKVILAIPPSCTSIVGSTPKRVFKYQGEYIPVLSTGLGSTAACAAGLKIALVARGDTETEVVAIVGDGGTYDIGLGGISGVAERNEDILYICLDNELYGNTGGQTSSATPWGARTTTSLPPTPKMDFKKDIIGIMAAHRIPYLATATVAFPDDFIAKVKRAKETHGFRFVHVLSPCVAGWLARSEHTVKISRLAVETGLFPLLEVEEGTRYTISREPGGVPVSEYLKLQGRYRHLTDADISRLQDMIDERWRYLRWLSRYPPEKKG